MDSLHKKKQFSSKVVRVITISFAPRVPWRKTIHNLSKTPLHQISHHQYDVPGIDPMDSPYPRIQFNGPLRKDSHPGPTIDLVLTPSRTLVSRPLVIVWNNDCVTPQTRLWLPSSENPGPPTKVQILQNEYSSEWNLSHFKRDSHQKNTMTEKKNTWVWFWCIHPDFDVSKQEPDLKLLYNRTFVHD